VSTDRPAGRAIHKVFRMLEKWLNFPIGERPEIHAFWSCAEDDDPAIVHGGDAILRLRVGCQRCRFATCLGVVEREASLATHDQRPAAIDEGDTAAWLRLVTES